MTLKPPPSHHQPPKPRRLNICHRHPDQPFTSLCTSCLRERLSLLNPSSFSASPNQISNLSATIPADVAEDEAIRSFSCSATSPELRRCKTFSGNKCESIDPAFQPRRRSCEARGRNSLSNLFHLDDGSGVECQVESKNLGILVGTCPVPPVLKEEEDEIGYYIDEIRVSDSDSVIVRNVDADTNKLNVEEDCEDSKTIKEFIDLDFKANNNNSKPFKKDLKEIAGSFWIAASVFSKKIQKWKRKQNTRSNNEAGDDEYVGNGCGSACGGDVSGTGLSLGEMRIENLRGRRLKDSQSEDGFGSRPCDTDPRCSIDLGRASIDCGRISVDGFGRNSCDADPRPSIEVGRASLDGRSRVSIVEGRQRRCSFDPPRSSWDGYLIGTTMRTPPPQPMVSVIENAMATVYGLDGRRGLIKEKLSVAGEDERKFVSSNYLNAAAKSSQRRKKESDHDADSNRNTKGVQLPEDEAKPVTNPVVLPATTTDICHGTKLVITEKELMGSRFCSVRDDSSESFELASKDVPSSSVSSSSIGGNGVKKCRQWSKILSVWGDLLSRRKHGKSGSEEDEKFDGHAADSLVREGDGEVTSKYNLNLVRSSSVAISRSSDMMIMNASERGMKSRNEIKYGLTKKKRQEHLVLKRNQSARHSPSSNLDNNMLRFYLTPLRSYRRSKIGKSRSTKSHSLARSVLGMY